MRWPGGCSAVAERAGGRSTGLALHRHADTFLSLADTTAERRFDMPYRKTIDYEGEFINTLHSEIVRRRHDTGMIDFGVEGWLLPADALKLYEMAYWSEGDIVELGAYRGLSAAVMNEACNERGGDTKIISIDLDTTAVELSRRTLQERAGGERAYFFQDDAASALRNLAAIKRRFGFAFVDHSHRYEHVFDACQLLHRVLDPGAFALFHDFNDPRNGREGEDDYGVYQGVVDGLLPGRWEFWGIYGCTGLFRLADPRRVFA